MSAVKATARPKRARSEPETLKPDLSAEIRRLHKIQALLIAVQHAANYDVEFDVSDALAIVVALVEESLAGLDRLEAAS